MFGIKNPFSKKKSSIDQDRHDPGTFKIFRNNPTLEIKPQVPPKYNINNVLESNQKPYSNSTLNNLENSYEYEDAASYHSIDSDGSFDNPKPAFGTPNIKNGFGNSNSNTTMNHVRELSNVGSSSTQIQKINSRRISEELPPSFDRQRLNKAKGKTPDKHPTKEELEKMDREKGEKYFQIAIKKHESGDLLTAAAYFKRSADLSHPSGLLFFGLCLRHGWGCKPNEKMAFLYLQKAGEMVVPESNDSNTEIGSIANKELAMAIYELGQSYYHGWGVPKSRSTAVHYYRIAADLGDPDAQSDVAACYENGDGVKRDLKKSAHYYRRAYKQGVQLFGNSWIFKDKYNSD
ncbi:hypothetical protein BB559_005642 [Furculomyces boomerangus]|uniref:Protein DSF2 n=2 Tax=Harpellales TaxID=61421 RepID=A0A2T9Y7F9_9FUNG|nr:hypothetical protein BB559_005642 [Furculomyces boomerangus]PWA02453.1 hypothetical protein BB558_001404 [Smittium angustum]